MDDPTTYLVSFDDAEARYVVFIYPSSLYNSLEVSYVFKACSCSWFRYLRKSVRFQL